MFFTKANKGNEERIPMKQVPHTKILTLNHQLLTINLLLGLAVALTGCTYTRPLKPGTARMQSKIATNGALEFVSEVKQPENPAQSAAQNYERTTETELPLARG